MPRKAKRWTIEQHGIRVRLFQKAATWWADIRLGTERQRFSLRTSERTTAEVNARALATEIATRELLGVTSSTLTLAQLFAAYDEHKGRALEGQWQRQAASRQRAFLAAWGGATRVVAISQTSIDEYARRRRQLYAAAHPGRVLRDGALDGDCRWLSSVMNWAHAHRLPDGKRLLDANPLEDVVWPREKNVRRPVASDDRYTRTLAVAHVVDDTGRFRLALAFARHTGHRIDAILRLRVSDVLRTPAAVRAAVVDCGLNEADAEHMPHGAVRWRAETDKMGMLHVAPLSPAMRAELDAYLATLPRIGDAPLFPAERNGDRSVRRFTATKWLLRAERLAELPKLAGGLWHPYRRLWATQYKHLPDVDVAAVGGWKGTKAMKLSYQQSTAEGRLAVVNGG
jgi:hypothetical protein